MVSGKKNRNQRKIFDSRRPGLLRIDQGWMGQSIGKCKENLKPEKYLTAEDQGRQHKTRGDSIRPGTGLGVDGIYRWGMERKIETRGRILTEEDQVD